MRPFSADFPKDYYLGPFTFSLLIVRRAEMELALSFMIPDPGSPAGSNQFESLPVIGNLSSTSPSTQFIRMLAWKRPSA
jgi:hypothetical protein